MQAVTGTYHDQKKAAAAVEALVEQSVPLDEVSVVVTDRAGSHEVPIVETSLVPKGAALGAGTGVLLGATGGILAATGVVDAPGVLGDDPLLMLVRAIVGVGGLGYAFGVLGSLSIWKDEPELRGEDLEKGEAQVVVHSDDLHDKARAVLEATEADRVTG